ncbi:MAG: TRAP transporter small permease [Aquabacterium sp.]
MLTTAPGRLARRAADAVGAGLFAAMFGVFLLQIVARFVFNRPLPWTDELAVVLYLWLILWASALMVRSREQVAFDLLYRALGPRGRRAMRAAGALLLGGLCLWALPGSLDYVRFMHREGTPVLGWKFSFVFAPFVLLLAALALRSAWALWRTLRQPDDPDDTDSTDPSAGAAPSAMPAGPAP